MFSDLIIVLQFPLPAARAHTCMCETECLSGCVCTVRCSSVFVCLCFSEPGRHITKVQRLGGRCTLFHTFGSKVTMLHGRLHSENWCRKSSQNSHFRKGQIITLYNTFIQYQYPISESINIQTTLKSTGTVRNRKAIIIMTKSINHNFSFLS